MTIRTLFQRHRHACPPFTIAPTFNHSHFRSPFRTLTEPTQRSFFTMSQQARRLNAEFETVSNTTAVPLKASRVPGTMARFAVSENVLSLDAAIKEVQEDIAQRDPDQNEFQQAFHEVLTSLRPVFARDPSLLSVLRTIAEPERVIIFRVPWLDANGIQQVNRGYRVQFSSALGPYKGGLRFHPTVTLSVMKFLGFEQIFKNALTGLPLGGGKGGSDFDPRGKTNAEILAFCQSFMTELHRHIGPQTDVPAGDINVGAREIGFLYGQYKRLTAQFDGTLTGKGLAWGGSLIRPEATGYGCVYFAQQWCKDNNFPLKNKRCVISGSGNVALYTAEKLLDLGAVPTTFSDSTGTIYEPEGFSRDQLARLMHIKNVLKGRVKDYCDVSSSAQYYEGKRPWGINTNIDMAFPCATQNELDENDATQLAASGCRIVVEGANMPTTPEGIQVLKSANIVLCPAKAANAGGVAVSGLEMAQNSMRTRWTREEVDQKLKDIMSAIYNNCKLAAIEYVQDPNDLLTGANITGFLNVVSAVTEQGCV